MEYNVLETETPENLGIPSGAIMAFLDRILDHRLNLHSLLILRGGKLAAEGYWAPFSRDRKHRLYSSSKSFTSLAVGRMISEGRLSLQDRVVQFFPEKLPQQVHPWIARATIRDMLMMADCHESPTYSFDDTDWLAGWFNKAPDHLPGMIYTYNTACTQVLCAIVEKLTGMKFLAYLRPVFDAIGASPDIWCIEAPDGCSFGGSGVMATPRDLARTALLFLNMGRHDGQQLISENYMREATTRQIDNYIDHATSDDDIEHQQGYGYQIWRTRHNGFCFYGMGCQLAIALPDKDLLVVTTGDTQGTLPDTSEVLSALWENLYDQISDGPLPENPGARNELAGRLLKLAMPVVQGVLTQPLTARINGITYDMAENPMGIKTVRYQFRENTGTLAYVNATGAHEISFGLGWNQPGVFPETHYSGRRIGTPKNAGYEMYASAAWRDEKTLLTVCYITDDYLGSLAINATFSDQYVTLLMHKRAEAFLNEYHGFASGRTGSLV